MESQSSTSSAQKSASAKRSKASSLLETRFVTEWNRPDWVAMAAAVAAGLLLGAGCYAAFSSGQYADYKNFLVLGGLIAIAVFVFQSNSVQSIVYVGDAGVAISKSGELTRLLWSEIRSIRYESEHLVLLGAQTSLRLPSRFHTRAIRAILGQAAERLPKILDVPGKLLKDLPVVEGDNPKPGPVESLQVAGKRCLVTDQLLTFERDARVCPVCTSIYHSAHVPATCVTCERPLGDAAVAIEA
jgi:hypothetical protein